MYSNPKTGEMWLYVMPSTTTLKLVTNPPSSGASKVPNQSGPASPTPSCHREMLYIPALAVIGPTSYNKTTQLTILFTSMPFTCRAAYVSKQALQVSVHCGLHIGTTTCPHAPLGRPAVM